MSITYYNQNNYGSIPYPSLTNKKATVKSSGCGVCCMSMIASGLAQHIPPPEMAQIAIKCKARVDGGTNISTLAKSLGYSYITTSNQETLKAHLKKDGIAIANVGGNRGGYLGVFSDIGHYLVVVKIAGSTVYMYDPGNYQGKYNINGRSKYASVSGDYVISDIGVLDKDCNNRSPKYYLFERSVNEVVNQGKIILNGTEKTVNLIEKDGENYIRIRDLADGIITVDYDHQKKMPTVKVK